MLGFGFEAEFNSKERLGFCFVSYFSVALRRKLIFSHYLMKYILCSNCIAILSLHVHEHFAAETSGLLGTMPGFLTTQQLCSLYPDLLQ